MSLNNCHKLLNTQVDGDRFASLTAADAQGRNTVAVLLPHLYKSLDVFGSGYLENRTIKRKAGDEIRTHDPNLGKVVLYQLSYARTWVYNLDSRKVSGSLTAFVKG